MQNQFYQRQISPAVRHQRSVTPMSPINTSINSNRSIQIGSPVRTIRTKSSYTSPNLNHPQKVMQHFGQQNILIQQQPQKPQNMWKPFHDVQNVINCVQNRVKNQFKVINDQILNHYDWEMDHKTEQSSAYKYIETETTKVPHLLTFQRSYTDKSDGDI